MAALQSSVASIMPISTTRNSVSSTKVPSEGSKEHTRQAIEHPDILARMAAVAALILLRNRRPQQLSRPENTTRNDMQHPFSNACGPSGGLSLYSGSAPRRIPRLPSSVQLLESTLKEGTIRLPEDDLLMALTEPYLINWCFP